MKISTRDIGPSVSKYAMAQYGGEVFYVDGTNGDDLFDGKSWVQAKATIQAAVDAANPWSTIYVKAGTYAEVVTISKRNLRLKGESASSVIVAPGSGASAVEVTADGVWVESMTVRGVSQAGATFGIEVTGCSYTHFEDLIVQNRDTLAGRGLRLRNAHNVVVSNIRTNGSYIPGYGINLYDAAGESSDDIVIGDCILDGCGMAGMHATGRGANIVIRHNIFRNCGTGLAVAVTMGLTSVYHNNLYSNTTNASNGSALAVWFENYYDDAGADADNDGLADALYTFATGSDDSAVVDFNGWERKALGIPKPT